MMYLQKSFTVPAGPQTMTACEKCCFGRGEHAGWCPVLKEEICSDLDGAIAELAMLSGGL